MDSKFIGTSKTVVGLLITAAALFCQWKGIAFTADDQGAVSDSILKLIEAIGIVIALVGRIVATKPLHILPQGDQPAPPSAGMLMLVGLLSLSVLSAGVLSGCSTFVAPTPATAQDQALREVRQATVLYIAAVTTFNGLVASNRIDKQTAIDLEIIRQRAWARLSAAKQAAEAGTPVDADTSLQLFMDDLNALNMILLKIPPVALPATVPATHPA